MSTLTNLSNEDQMNMLEALEPRIAPAGLNPAGFKTATAGSQILLHAGEGIGTSDGNSGTWLLYVEKGTALVFTTDLNSNGQVDANEITGISAGDGLRLTSFVDIHGDIVTNLDANGQLTDSDTSTPERDGLVVLNSKIEKITMRSVTASDVPAGTDPMDRLALSSYSIYGNIFAGGGFGVAGGGLVIDTSGYTMQLEKFDGVSSGGTYLPQKITPSIGSIKVGTAVSGEFFNFGITTDTGVQVGTFGILKNFKPATGQAGADIIGVKATQTQGSEIDPVTGEVTVTFSNTEFKIGDLEAGNGGFGARGGNIQDVFLFGDTGATHIIAGKGGDGQTGGAGGSIINLQDNGSITGRIYIQTGDGGRGLTGAGGAGGSLSLGNFNAAAYTTIVLGDGGDGLMSGGNGASLLNGNIAPNTDLGIASALGLVSTTHIAWDRTDPLNPELITTLGKPYSLDFNGDGFSDYVYLTVDPQQMVVVYGDGTGTGSLGQLVLDVAALNPIGTKQPAIVAGDINGDGYDDIVIGANSDNSLGGLMTFMSNGDGFETARYSALPFFTFDGLFRTTQAMVDLELGDFDGDGVVDVAVGAHTYEIRTSPHDATIMYIASGSHDVNGKGTGVFFVDFQKDANSLINQMPYTYINDTHLKFKIEATASSTAGSLNGRDILVGAVLEDGNHQAISTFAMDGALDQVDSIIGQFRGRQENEGVITPVGNPTNATPTDFTILDVDGDGVFDVAAIETTNSSLILLKGAADATIDQPSIDGVPLTNTGGLFPSGSTFVGIKAFDADGVSGPGNFNSVALYTFNSAGFPGLNYLEVTGFAQVRASDNVVVNTGGTGLDGPQGSDQNVIVWDVFRGLVNDGEAGFAYAPPVVADVRFDYHTTTFDNAAAYQLASHTFELSTGSGGSSNLGNGGNGGGINNLTFVIPKNLDSVITFQAGDGGNGGKNGGSGGSLAGIDVHYADGITGFTSGVRLWAGDGGNGLALGGVGGSISKFTTITGFSFLAGDGGSGKVGGAGGSITGAGSDANPDTRDAAITAIAGSGGNGVTTGGKGGSVTNFRAVFISVNGTSGNLYYQAGDGGNASAGRAGDGGSITNSSPAKTPNFLTQDITLLAGAGGDGLTGGNGGTIATFFQSNTQDNPARVVTAIAGNGGNGVTGNGGVGGSVNNLNIAGTGVNDFVKMSRIIAGNGGESFGAIGGLGGSITTVQSTAIGSSIVFAAGAGGDGLTRGGVGGSLTNIQTDATNSLGSKVLGIAGKGGDAFAFTAASISSSPDFADQTLAYGGTLGFGGNGGSISGFTQVGNANAVTDLIAGNGGSTRNYGSSSDTKFNVGKGGSVSNIVLAGYSGTAASSQAGIPIKSYVTDGQSYEDFIFEQFIQNPNTPLTNDTGNVGVIVGVSGNVANGNPSTSDLNGSVSNFTARGIMSMVAGSVDRISTILSVSGLKVESGGALGSYKSEALAPNPVDPNIPHPAGQTPTYFSGPDRTGTLGNSPTLGGSLFDGAIVTKDNKDGLVSPRIFVLG
jgi:hypothetical protein